MSINPVPPKTPAKGWKSKPPANPTTAEIKEAPRHAKTGGLVLNGFVTEIKEPRKYTKNGKELPLGIRNFTLFVPVSVQAATGENYFEGDAEGNAFLKFPAEWTSKDEKDNHIDDVRSAPLYDGMCFEMQTDSVLLENIFPGQFVSCQQCKVRFSRNKKRDKPDAPDHYENLECSVFPVRCGRGSLATFFEKMMYLNTFIHEFVPSIDSEKFEWDQALIVRVDNDLDIDSLITERGVDSYVSETTSMACESFFYEHPKEGNETVGKRDPKLSVAFTISQQTTARPEEPRYEFHVDASAKPKHIQDWFQLGTPTETWTAIGPLLMSAFKGYFLMRVEKGVTTKKIAHNDNNKYIRKGYMCGIFADVAKLYETVGVPVSAASVQFGRGKGTPIPPSVDVVRMGSDYDTKRLQRSAVDSGVRSFRMLVGIAESATDLLKKEVATLTTTDGDEIAKILEDWDENRKQFLDAAFVPATPAQDFVKKFAKDLPSKDKPMLVYFAILDKDHAKDVEQITEKLIPRVFITDPASPPASPSAPPNGAVKRQKSEMED